MKNKIHHLLEVQKEIDQLEKKIKEKREASDLETLALGIVNQALALGQEKVRLALIEWTNLILSAIFEDPYTMDLITSTETGKATARIVLRKNGQEFDPLTEAGGGVVDMIAFGLRISALIISGRRRILIFDEPFRFLSVEYREELVRRLLSLLSGMGIQIILVTHHPDLFLGKVVKLK